MAMGRKGKGVEAEDATAYEHWAIEMEDKPKAMEMEIKAEALPVEDATGYEHWGLEMEDKPKAMEMENQQEPMAIEYEDMATATGSKFCFCIYADSQY